MTRLSVNINKVATIRNARGGNIPNVLKFAKDCEYFGADGITVHPRPDERHITYNDVHHLSKILIKEFNIEGYPSKEFMNLILDTKPNQVTLVPDKPNAITSDSGWNFADRTHLKLLNEVILKIKSIGARVSLFINANVEDVKASKHVGADHIELYTGPFSSNFDKGNKSIIESYAMCAKMAESLSLGVNSGHDLNLNNLGYFINHVSPLYEVSIGHALISDALYLGLEKTIQSYKTLINT